MSTSWKKRLALLLLLVFTSQSMVALLASCSMEDSSSESRLVAHDMYHYMEHDQVAMKQSLQNHDALADSAADDSAVPRTNAEKADCCDALGHCLMAGCLVIHAATSTSALSFSDGSTVAGLDKLFPPLVIPSSHFRPPILG